MQSHIAETFSESSIEDISLNPHKYGMPSFAEYKRNRSKYLGKKDDGFGLIDKGSKMLGKLVKNHVYEIEGIRCKSLEEVETRAKNELGIDIDALDYRPTCIPLGGGKCDILVKFMRKDEIDRRRRW